MHAFHRIPAFPLPLSPAITLSIIPVIYSSRRRRRNLLLRILQHPVLPTPIPPFTVENRNGLHRALPQQHQRLESLPALQHARR